MISYHRIFAVVATLTLSWAACKSSVTGQTTSTGGHGQPASASSTTGGGAPGAGGGSTCPPRTSAGCCPGDGTCCDCVGEGVCTPSFEIPNSDEVAFDTCVCQACAAECSGACAGSGIDQGCPACAAKAAKGACASEYAPCPCKDPGGQDCWAPFPFGTGGAGGAGTGGTGTGGAGTGGV